MNDQEIERLRALNSSLTNKTNAYFSVMREQLTFAMRKDGTLQKRTRTGSYRNVNKEKLPFKIQERLALLALLDSGYIAGVGGTNQGTFGDTYFFVEHL